MSDIIRKAKNIVLVRFPVADGFEYVVTSCHWKWGISEKRFSDLYTSLQFFTLNSRTLAFAEAKEAGLDDHTADRVALGKMTLEAALGDMDVSDESEFMELYDEEYLADQGGEDDNTPPLEVLMAGGWSSWEYQNEKNAWLDSRF